MQKIKERIKELNKILKEKAKEYYENDDPSIEDSEYDLLMSELKKYESQNPKLILKDSITQLVGGKPKSSLNKIKHQYPMKSLNDIFNLKDLENFNKQISQYTNTLKNTYTAELKIDGLSISLIYENGDLKLAATRGDGLFGEDVTENVKQIKSIPLKISSKNKIEVRGEIYLPKKEFDRINTAKILNGEQVFANPRNAASGTLRQLDSKIVKERNLSSFIYYYFDDSFEGKTQLDSLKQLRSLGFKTNPETQLVTGIDELKKYIDKYNLLRNSLEYEIDGIVFKLNNISLQNIIGSTSKFPKWATAYKFPAEIKTTKLLDIFPTVGRTGKITYNAKLDPVLIAGSMVSAATLNNAEYIKAKDLRIGATVKIKKAGDIIPEVISAIKDDNFIKLKIWEKNTICPSCAGVLEIVDGEIDQFCINFSCPAQIVRSLQHFVSRDAANIIGFGPQTIQKLYDAKIIQNISDIYKLKTKKDLLMNFEKMGEKTFKNLINSIEVSKTISLEKTLYGLGIRHIGKTASKKLCENFKTLENIKSATLEELMNIESFGKELSTSVYDWFRIPSNLKLLDDLIDSGLNTKYIFNLKTDNSLISNKIFVITGTLSKPREYFKELIELNNGKITSTISSKTDYVLTGEKPGSKLKKAQDLKVTILNEQDFNKLLN